MKLAKAALDVGLYTNQREAMLDFWQHRAGVPFDELLPVGRGVQQHRHLIGESILKINHSRDPMAAAAPAGYRRLILAREGRSSVEDLTDPDGNKLRLVPKGHQGIEQFELEIAVRDLAATTAFYRDALQLEQAGPGRFRCGVSLVSLHQDDSAAFDPPMRAPGFRYTTLQVYDVLAEHAGILARGGREGAAPVKLGEVAYISFVRDPDGNWIEISQRKSLTGSLAAGEHGHG
ncbi:MAG TPA: VOC family protein [Burkholderiaceae bacterium]|nr:VOC family protein [Burkholderiaceae bacterium]